EEDRRRPAHARALHASIRRRQHAVNDGARRALGGCRRARYAAASAPRSLVGLEREEGTLLPEERLYFQRRTAAKPNGECVEAARDLGDLLAGEPAPVDSAAAVVVQPVGSLAHAASVRAVMDAGRSSRP